MASRAEQLFDSLSNYAAMGMTVIFLILLSPLLIFMVPFILVGWLVEKYKGALTYHPEE